MKKNGIILIGYLLAGVSFGQTLPTTFNLSSGDYSFTSWAASSTAGTFPSHMTIQRTSVIDPGVLEEMSSDYSLAYNLASGSRVNGLDGNGISFINTGTLGTLGAAIVGLNASGRKNITVSFTAGTVVRNFRNYALRLQVKIGAGLWSDVPGPVEYIPSTDGHFEEFNSIVLPSTVNDEEEVYIRWKYYQVNADVTGARPQIRLDEIVITSQPDISSIPTKLNISLINNGSSPSANTPFSVVVQSLDNENFLSEVDEDTEIELELSEGDGSLSGILTGTLLSGESSVTINGVSYNQDGSDIEIKAHVLSGMSLTDAFKVFNVLPKASYLFITVLNSSQWTDKAFSLTAQARRLDESVDLNFSQSVTVSLSSGSGNLNGIKSLNSNSGSVTFTGLSFDLAGEKELTVSADGLSSGLSVLINVIQSPIMNELVIPKYLGSKTTASTNTNRTAIAMCVSFSHLLPNSTYKLKAGLALVEDAPTSFGAGNLWNGTAFSGDNINNAFVTDEEGESGPVWIYIQPTGNATRFGAGSNHILKVGVVEQSGVLPTNPDFISSKTIKALDIAPTPMTGDTSDDGAFIYGTANISAEGKFVLVYNNVEGSDDPFFVYRVLNHSIISTTQSSLPSIINDIYSQSGLSQQGNFLAIIPIGENNENGIRRIEVRNEDNSLFAVNTDEDGIWPSGANTTTLTRMSVVELTYSDASLPVELSSFTIAKIGNDVVLNWSTTTETNNYGFEVEGQKGSTWNKVGFVAGKGTTTEVQSYSFIDHSVSSGTISYRLKQIDYDGKYEYSTVQTIDVTPETFELLGNYPNPFNPTTLIYFQTAYTGQVTVTVFDVLGRQINVLVNEEKPAGIHQIPFNSTGLSSGLYFYQVKAGNEVRTGRMLLSK